MSKEERYEILKTISWDYSIPLSDLDDLILGKKEEAGHYTRVTILKKMLSSLPWFVILRFFPLKYLKQNLTPSLIDTLWPASLKAKYGYVYTKLKEVE